MTLPSVDGTLRPQKAMVTVMKSHTKTDFFFFLAVSGHVGVPWPGIHPMPQQ